MFIEKDWCLNGIKSVVCGGVCVCEADSSVQLTGVLFVLQKQLVSSASTLAG